MTAASALFSQFVMKRCVFDRLPNANIPYLNDLHISTTLRFHLMAANTCSEQGG